MTKFPFCDQKVVIHTTIKKKKKVSTRNNPTPIREDKDETNVNPVIYHNLKHVTKKMYITFIIEHKTKNNYIP